MTKTLLLVVYSSRQRNVAALLETTGDRRTTEFQEIVRIMKSTTTRYQLVYAIQAINLKVIKIGFSGDLNQRLRDLQTGSPDELRVIGCWPGSASDEQEIHRTMAQWRLHREWFYPSPELLALIESKNRAQDAGERGKLAIHLENGERIVLDRTAYKFQYKETMMIDPPGLLTDIIASADSLRGLLPGHQAIAVERMAILADIVLQHYKSMASTRPEYRNKPIPNAKVRCSFCNNHVSQVETLVEGPRAYICDECITVCDRIANERREVRQSAVLGI